MNFLKSRHAKQLLEITQLVKQNAENPFVQEYVDLPSISQLRLQLLYLFLKEQNISEVQIKKFCVSSILIQMGLDSHEEVPLQGGDSLHQVRSRQLRVLAGDYFSSRYYYLLAELEDTETIKMLASSIQQINEAKMGLYLEKMKKTKLSGSSYLDYVNIIDSGLCLSFVSRYATQTRQAWSNIIQKLILVERLLDDYRSYRWDNKMQGYFALIWDHIENYQTIHDFLQMIEGLLQTVKHLASSCKKEETRKEILQLIAEFAKQIDLAPGQIVKEL